MKRIGPVHREEGRPFCGANEAHHPAFCGESVVPGDEFANRFEVTKSTVGPDNRKG